VTYIYNRYLFSQFVFLTHLIRYYQYYYDCVTFDCGLILHQTFY